MDEHVFGEMLVLLRRGIDGGAVVPLVRYNTSLRGILQTALEGSMNCNARQVPSALQGRRLAVLVSVCVPCGMVDDALHRSQLLSAPTFDEVERDQVNVVLEEGEWTKGNGLSGKHLLTGCAGHVGWSGVVECESEKESESEGVERFLKATSKAVEEARGGLDPTRGEEHKIFVNVVVVTSDDDVWSAVTGQSTKKRKCTGNQKGTTARSVAEGNVALGICLGARVIVPVEEASGGMHFKQMQWQAPFGKTQEGLLQSMEEKLLSQSLCGCLDENWKDEVERELRALWPGGELDRALAGGEPYKSGRKDVGEEKDAAMPAKGDRFGDVAFRLVREEFRIEASGEGVTFRSSSGVWVDCGQIATVLYALVHECVCNENDGAAMSLIIDSMLFWMGGAWVEQSATSSLDWSYWLDLIVNALHLRVSAREIGPGGMLHSKSEFNYPAVTQVAGVKTKKRAHGGKGGGRAELL